MAVASMIVILIMVGLAIAAPVFVVLTGHPPNTTYPEHGENCIRAAGRALAPTASGSAPTGSGRDLLIRILYGARISLFVGIFTTAIATVAGVTIGMVAGYFGGVVDAVLARFIDAVLAFPFVVLALALAVVLGPSLTVIIGVISFFSWAGISRIVRGQTLSIKEKEYIEAARSLGAGPRRIMFVHVLPNLLAPGARPRHPVHPDRRGVRGHALLSWASASSRRARAGATSSPTRRASISRPGGTWCSRPPRC